MFSNQEKKTGEDKKSKTFAGTDNLPWVEKFRPKRLDELVSHTDILNTISKLIEKNKMPHLLLYGPAGTGKTSTILACAREIYGNGYQNMILELNASDDRGIDVVRNQVKSFASSKKLFSATSETHDSQASNFKLIVLDEADSMTRSAQFALRRIIEKYTRNTRFCLICNYINKIIPALQSRCTRFRFGPLDREQITIKMEEIAKKENVNMTKDGLKAIIDLASGDMRKCLNVLQACHLAYPVVDEEKVYHSTGKPRPKDIERILDLLMNEPFRVCIDEIWEMITKQGLSLVDIVQGVHILVLQVRFPPDVLMQLVDKLSDVEHRMAFGTNERIQLASVVGIFKIVCENVINKMNTDED